MTEFRLHIGNIAPALADDPTRLLNRLAKFGKVLSPLEIKCKPLADFHFGFITMELEGDQGFQKLKRAFHEVIFMGKKLSVEVLKPKYDWNLDNARPDAAIAERIKRETIAEARAHRIKEAQTKYPVNSITGLLTCSLYLDSRGSSVGYELSSHVSNSANTKNRPPSSSLMGIKSYSTTTQMKATPYNNHFSHTSGHGLIIKGRHRSVERNKKDIRNSTLRILINGELKTYKNYKTKLWGFDQTKTARDLTWSFDNGVWKSGDNHVMERVGTQQTGQTGPVMNTGQIGQTCAIGADEAEQYGQDNEPQNDPIVAGEVLEEKANNLGVLAQLFSSYDFDKPMEVEEEEQLDITYDTKGRRQVRGFDYEAEGALSQDEGDFDVENPNVDLEAAQEEIRAYERENANKVQQNFTYFDEDDEGNNMDFELTAQSTEHIKDKYEEEHTYPEHNGQGDNDGNDDTKVQSINEGEDEDDDINATFVTAQENVSSENENVLDGEFIPTFGASNTPLINDTETLRQLFRDNKSSQIEDETSRQDNGFKLEISDDDIDEEKVPDAKEEAKLLAEIKKKQEEELRHYNEKRRAQFGLFWIHSDSPFLAAQSQMHKLSSEISLPGQTDKTATTTTTSTTEENTESEYEKWFWSKRGELSRECKRRRRDVVRSFQRKSKSIGGV